MIPVVMSSGQTNAEIVREGEPSLTCLHEAPVLAHSLRADGFDASEGVAGTLAASGAGTQRPGGNANELDFYVPVAFDARQSDVIQYGHMEGPLDTDGHSQAVAFAQNTRDEVRLQGGDGQIVGALASQPGMKQTSYVAAHGMMVRRLTPTECARLQGFPDTYLDIPYRGKPAADGPKYKALGNSMAVPVISWIGRRIQMVEDLCDQG